MTPWEPLDASGPALVAWPLTELDRQISRKFSGPHWEFRVADHRKLVLEVRGVPLEEHEHHWSLPIDELRNKRACTFPGCGHIATRDEMREIFFREHRRVAKKGAA